MPDTIGSRISEWMDRENLTTTKIMQETRISSGNISEWRNGIKMPSVKALIKLYETYNAPINWILTGSGILEQKNELLGQYQSLNEKNKKIIKEQIRHMIVMQEIEG